jgi:hypothetical protein
LDPTQESEIGIWQQGSPSKPQSSQVPIRHTVKNKHAGPSVQHGSPLSPQGTQVVPEQTVPASQSSGGISSQHNWSAMPQG